MTPTVEDNHMTGLRPHNRTPAFDRCHACGITVIRYDELTTCARPMIGEEEQCGKRIGINVTFESHCRSMLYVEHGAVTFVPGRLYRMVACYPLCKFEKPRTIQLRQPGKPAPHLISVYSASRDSNYSSGFP